MAARTHFYACQSVTGCNVPTCAVLCASVCLSSKRMMEDRSGQRGLPHVDARPPTVPAPFAFKTDQRAVEHAGPSSSSAAAAAAAGAGDDVFVFGAQGEGGRLTRSRAKQPWTGHLTQMAPFQLATDIRG